MSHCWPLFLLFSSNFLQFLLLTSSVLELGSGEYKASMLTTWPPLRPNSSFLNSTFYTRMNHSFLLSSFLLTKETSFALFKRWPTFESGKRFNWHSRLKPPASYCFPSLRNYTISWPQLLIVFYYFYFKPLFKLLHHFLTTITYCLLLLLHKASFSEIILSLYQL